jgi:phage-related protein
MKTIHIDTFQIHHNAGNGGYMVNKNIQGLEIPSIRLPSFDRPNVDGAIVPNQLYGGRLITLEGKVMGNTVADYRQKRRDLENAVSINRVAGILYPRTLKFTTMDDLNLQVEVYTKQLTFPDTEMLFGNFQLNLFAPSLYLLSQTQHIQSIYGFTGGGFSVPAEIPFAMNVGGGSPAVLNNAGNTLAYPLITLTGPLNNPSIVNETTGEQMDIAYNLDTSAKYITIDVLNRTVLYYSAFGATPTNARQYLTGEFITLAPGNNSVKLVLAAYNADGVAQFTWRDSYTGI